MDKEDVLSFLKNKKIVWGIAIVIFLVVLFLSVEIRFSNWNTLFDQTTGQRLSPDLDATYFLRITETIAANGGHLPSTDTLRYSPGFQVGWDPEIMTWFIYYASKIIPTGYSLSDLTLASPVFFFAITLVIFFILIYLLTRSVLGSVLSSTFLAFTPAYLMRTVSGFCDHDDFGMMFFILALLVYYVSLKFLNEKNNYKYAIGGGILTGFATTLSIVSWGGIAKFLFILIPLSFFMLWLFKTRKGNVSMENEKKFVLSGIIFYFVWLISILISGLFFKYSAMSIFQGYMIASQGILSLAVLVFVLVNSIFIYQKKFKLKENLRIFYSLAGALVLGIVGLTLIGKNVFSLVVDMIHRFLSPFDTGRLGLTVAENQAPYISDWISQTGSILFWFFILGTFLFGYYLGKNIKNIKRRIIFICSYVLMVGGIIFSKYSATSILNGSSFLSDLVYFIPLVFFWIYFFWLYTKEEFSFSHTEIFIFAWIFITIICGRAAERMFFAITPFVCFMGAYFVISLLKEWKKSRDETYKIVMLVFFILALVGSVLIISSSYSGISSEAKYMGPSENPQWQNAMAWGRNNTATDSVFAHWWDYGYWVESLGERRTVADGGHFEGDGGDYEMGRYVLTTPKPETALSFFKSMNVSYLLIDPSDLGKYPAYSKIGSDYNWDRFSIIPTGVMDPSQTIESNNQTKNVYILSNGIVDQDIIYQQDGKNIFLPGPTYDSEGNPSYKAGIAGIILATQGGKVSAPEGVFIYNGQQYRIPLRYVYANGKLYDFKMGLGAVMMIIPSVDQSSISPMGAAIYLSPKVSRGLFADLYLMNDAFNEYPTIKLAHSEDDYVVNAIKNSGVNVSSDFVYYNGFRGPLKIFDVQNIPANIVANSAFYEPFNGVYAGLDNLTFIKE